jgi:predicted O-linked N-acetylglucosamine transferase (SPINDLY family)
MASRMSASMLTGLGRTEWIAKSEDEYVEKVISLASDIELRKSLRANQRAKMAQSQLCDARDLAANLENAYVEMFERWIAIQAPNGIPATAERCEPSG